jgi:WS/DGAT/MGAT family acyltransferase
VTARVPLRAEDALFLHAQTPLLSQQVGAVLLLESAAVPSQDFRREMAQRVQRVPELRRRLERPRSTWRRPCWVTEYEADFVDRIRHVMLGRDGCPAALADVIDGFFSRPCDPFDNPWQMLLVRGTVTGQTVVAVKVHHTAGDSNAIIAMLSALFDPAAGASRAGARSGRPGPPARHGRVRVPGRGAAQAVRGLCHLAAAGRAPALSVCGTFTSDRRRYLPVALPAREVAVTARRLRVGIADLLLILITEALGQLLRARGEETAGRTVRVAVPRSRVVRAARSRRTPANRSAALALDLPIGPLTLAERVTAVRGQLGAHQRRGEPEAAALVLRALNWLPPPLQRRAAVQLYRHRWFNLLVSVFPGQRRGHRLLGARVAEVYPVLALADGVGLAIGAMTWETSLSIGILADAGLVPDADRLAAGLTGAFRRAQAAAGRDGPVSPGPSRGTAAAIG